MIKVTNKDLNNTTLIPAFQKLRNTSGLEVKTAHNIRCIGNKLDTFTRDAQQTYFSLLKKYAEKDEQGNPVPVKDDNGKIQVGAFKMDDGKKEDFDKEFKSFLEITHEMNRPRLTVEELNGAGLSANDLDAISPLLHELSVVDGEGA